MASIGYIGGKIVARYGCKVEHLSLGKAVDLAKSCGCAHIVTEAFANAGKEINLPIPCQSPRNARPYGLKQ